MPAFAAPAADPHADDARPQSGFASPAEQQAVDVLRARLRARFPAGRAYTLADLRDPAFPAPVARFVAQALQRRLVIEREALRGARSPWFDHDAPAVEGAWDDLFDTLDAHARVPEAEWPRALDQAAGQVALYLLRPAPTLAAFVFADGAPDLPVGVILRRMAYFTSYPYLRDVVAAYVAQRGLERLDRDTFERLLARVERRTPTAYRGQWTTLLGDLFDTLGQPADADGTGAPVLPARVLAPALADRGLDGLAGRLAAYDGALALGDLARLIDDEPLPPASRPVPPAPPDTAPVAPAPPAYLDTPPTGETTSAASDVSEEPDAFAAVEITPDDLDGPTDDDTVGDETDDTVGDETDDADVDETDEWSADAPDEVADERDADASTDPAPVDSGTVTAPDPLPVPPAPAAPVWAQATAAPASAPDEAPAPPPPPAASPIAARAPSGTDDAAPIWAQASTPAATPPPPASAPGGGDADADDDERPLWQRFLRRDRADALPDGDGGSLDSLEAAALGAGPHAQRAAFVGALFGGDAGAYVTALRRLAAADSWSDAAAALLDTFRGQGVDLYDATAVAFTDAAEQRFLR